MSVRLGSRNTPAGCALQKSILHEERLVHFLDRFDIFAYGSRYRSNADRPAIELLDDRLEYACVHIVQTKLIDIEQLQRFTCNIFSDASCSADLCVVTNASQEPIGHTRS